MAVLESHALNGANCPGVNWAFAVAQDDGADDAVALFLASGTDADKVDWAAGTTENSRRSIGHAPVLNCKHDQNLPLGLTLGGEFLEVSVCASRTDLFAGLNVGVAIRNGERPQVVADWMAYHQRHHGMDGALIVDRDPTGTLVAELGELVADLDMARVIILTPDFPMGRAGLPDEAHPYCSPDAPGKDRMEIPPPDPWRAPLGELVIYELLKELYLGPARGRWPISTPAIWF
jgi:hypothetical protein